jgi:hypothetical protein
MLFMGEISNYIIAGRGWASWAAVLLLLAGRVRAATGPEAGQLPPATAAPAVFWSLKAPARPSVPAIGSGGWARNPIDHFIMARLEKEKLHPSAEANRVTLIRRLSFDLTGLPPTPAEVGAFARDRSPGAYEKVVDRLLSSPRYGERWARHWLDVVRFAESHGFEMNQPRPDAWPYRDYVIRAFNEDKPYDRFAFEQLAGDAVGADDATGFLVGGPYDQVKSPDVQLTKQQRADELHDMVATTGSAFLGLTVGCARCHNHKFDPISQKDYYSMQAVFAGVEHGERPWRRPGDAERRAKTEAIRGELAALDRQLEAFEPLARLPANAAAKILPRRARVNPRKNTDLFVPVLARFVRFTILESEGAPGLDELEVYTAEESPRNVGLASAGAKATASGTIANFPIHQVEHLNDARYGNDWSWISNQEGRGWAQLELGREYKINRVVWGRDREGKFSDRVASRYRIEVALETNHWTTVATSEDRASYKAEAKPDAGYTTEGMPPGASDKLAGLLAQRTKLEARLPEFSATPMIYGGSFEKPPLSHRLYRGDPMQPREAVAPAGIAEVAPAWELAGDAPEQERRIALARWICDPRNPLTARVIVNRLWHYHFGRGIVGTPSDFGEMGERPSHLELLDWLACELMANGWRLKPIQRLIVLSSAYRQSSAEEAGAMKQDAGDRWLWRFSPRRLEAEEIRDAILATSGKLDLRMGGPGFDVFQPNNNYVRVYAAKEEFGPPEWRRMIYQFKPRMQQDGVFGAFDCPDGAQIAPKRTSSITALQALNLLNSGFLLQQGGFLAGRLGREAGSKPREQARRAFALAFNREPSRRELGAAARFIQQEGLDAFCRALFNANEFVFIY